MTDEETDADDEDELTVLVADELTVLVADELGVLVESLLEGVTPHATSNILPRTVDNKPIFFDIKFSSFLCLDGFLVDNEFKAFLELAFDIVVKICFTSCIISENFNN